MLGALDETGIGLTLAAEALMLETEGGGGGGMKVGFFETGTGWGKSNSESGLFCRLFLVLSCSLLPPVFEGVARFIRQL
jgi:hypothetical protein